MGMRKIDFITDLGKMDIAYFDFSVEKLMEDAKNAHISEMDSKCYSIGSRRWYSGCRFPASIRGGGVLCSVGKP